ncbi:hypothetical protein CCP3SC1AL1_90001 [Gammaproteobacteria bacterium]
MIRLNHANVIGTLIGSCLLMVGLFVDSVNVDVFSTWVTKDLLLKLSTSCVIVMDNAAFHKRLDIQKAIEDAGHILEFLPPCKKKS